MAHEDTWQRTTLWCRGIPKKIFLAQWEQSFTRASVRSNLQLIMTKLPTLITFFKKSMEAFTVMLGGFSSFVGLFLAIFHFEFF